MVGVFLGPDFITVTKDADSDWGVSLLIKFTFIKLADILKLTFFLSAPAVHLRIPGA